MGITKRPTDDSSDELFPVEIDEQIIPEIIDHSSDSENEEEFNVNYDDMQPIIIDSAAYYQSFFPELMISFETNNDNREIDTKQSHSVAFKKKNVSQMGRRKANRAQNESFLLSLGGDQSKHPEDEIFFNDNKNGFTKAINRLCTWPDLKESFIEGKDELVLKKDFKQCTTENNNDKKSKRSNRPDIAFKNLTTSQKSLFKQNSLPCAAIDHLETEVVQYFSLVPNGVYTSEPLPSYHRMLLHSIVRYYSLDAMSMNSRGRRAQKIVQVRNSHYDDFRPPKMTLLQYVSNSKRYSKQ